MLLGTLRAHTIDDLPSLLEEAASLGVRGIDTADVYGTGPAFETASQLSTHLPVQTKGGLVRTRGRWLPKGTAKHLTSTAAHSASLHPIDAFLLHTVDPAVGLGRSWRALLKLRERGVTPRIGLCDPHHHDLKRLLDTGVDVIQVGLSVFDLSALETGVVRLALENGVRVQAHSPLGGWRRKRRVHRALAPIAYAHGVSAERLALRWLEALGVEPVVGCTRVETLRDAMGPVPDAAVAEALSAIPISKRALAPPNPRGDGHIVLIMGIPASGKTHWAQRYVDDGYTRLNRDTLGGTLKGLVKRLAEQLDQGVRRFVLDNTFTDRAIRARVVALAEAHDCRVHCVWVDTPQSQALSQAVLRILADGDGLPEPPSLNGKPPHLLPPRAIFRHTNQLEPPTEDEGFTVERVQAPDLTWGTGSAVFTDLEGLASHAFETAPHVLAWTPDAKSEERLEALLAEKAVASVSRCRHPAGPPVCWCRLPLPGSMIQVLQRENLDPARCLAIGGRSLGTLAERLEMPFHRL